VAQPAPKNNIADKGGMVTPEWLFWLQGLADQVFGTRTPPGTTPPGTTTPPETTTPPDTTTPPAFAGSGGGTVIINNYGTGTPGTITKWTAPRSLGDSIMTETDQTVTVHGALIATTLQGRIDPGSIPPATPIAHHASHEPGGSDALALTAAARLFGRGESGAGAVEEIDLGTNLTMLGTTLNALTQSSPIFTYSFSAATTEPPGSDQLRFNAGSPYSAVTKVWARNVTFNGNDVYHGLKAIPVGSRLVIQDKNDHTQYAYFQVSAPTIDKTTYFEIPVTFVEQGSALSGGQPVLLQSNITQAVFASLVVVREIPIGVIDGSNATFTLANTPVADSEQVFLNGLLQDARSVDYSISGAVLVFLMPPLSGDRVLVTYERT
jgi:hypothetical protein